MSKKQEQQQQPQEGKQSWAQRLGEWIKDNRSQQPAIGAELKAIGREAIKDVRNTIHEAFFGKPEGMREPGAPLNSTQAEISKDRGVVDAYQSTLEDYASRGNAQGRGQEKDKGIER